LLKRADGQHFVYTVALYNPTAVINLAAAGAVMGVGRNLLAKTR
jgi:hypothetical protein